MLDSIADHVFYPAIMISLYIIAKEQIITHKPIIIYLGAWWLINFTIMIWRFKKIRFIHLNSVRATVTILVIYSLTSALIRIPDTIFEIMLLLFALRMAEETMTYLTMNPKKINPDTRYYTKTIHDNKQQNNTI